VTINRIEHVGIAVNSIDEAVKLYTEVLGLKVAVTETVEEQKVKIAVIPVGESKIELLESTDPEGAIAKFIGKRGEGMHHLALGVTDIEAALKQAREGGIPLIDEKPRHGIQNTKIAFLHPKGTKILLELVET